MDLARESGRIADAPFRVYLNDGAGRFTLAPEGTLLPRGTTGTGLDVEFADFDSDGKSDLYLASRGTVDRLLLWTRPER